MLLLVASSCGTHDRSPAGIAAGTPDSGAAATPDAAAATSAQPVVGGRDPPTGGTPGGVATSAEGESNWVPNAVVERVVDGDTLVARIGNRSETVRLIGVDTPESVAPTRPVQCFGKEASHFLTAALPAGTEITLVRDVEARDVYDRLLGYVVRSRDGLFINLELVAAGYAAVLSYPPNDHFADALGQAQAEAIAAGRGLWSVCGGPDVPLD
ncbi:MAG: thermonuclease family protein [Acidimicrobiaceae bacterium]|nr:thermonuclease family protein [Acidimicrobiaceae bacterium]